jgi:hypothetical protein
MWVMRSEIASGFSLYFFNCIFSELRVLKISTRTPLFDNVGASAMEMCAAPVL